MVKRHISSSELSSVANEHEFFIWNFITKNYGSQELYSYFKTYERINLHPVKEIVDMFNIPYFESYIEDEYDFVGSLRSDFAKKMWVPKFRSQPVMMGFHKRSLVASTWDVGGCYCKEGMIELIYKTNPSFFDNINID